MRLIVKQETDAEEFNADGVAEVDDVSIRASAIQLERLDNERTRLQYVDAVDAEDFGNVEDSAPSTAPSTAPATATVPKAKVLMFVESSILFSSLFCEKKH